MLRRPLWSIVTLSLLCGAAFASDTKRPDIERKPVEVSVQKPAKAGENAKVKTSVGTFEVNEKNVELLRKTIAGEKVEGVQLWAGDSN